MTREDEFDSSVILLAVGLSALAAATSAHRDMNFVNKGNAYKFGKKAGGFIKYVTQIIFGYVPKQFVALAIYIAMRISIFISGLIVSLIFHLPFATGVSPKLFFMAQWNADIDRIDSALGKLCYSLSTIKDAWILFYRYNLLYIFKLSVISVLELILAGIVIFIGIRNKLVIFRLIFSKSDQSCIHNNAFFFLDENKKFKTGYLLQYLEGEDSAEYLNIYRKTSSHASIETMDFMDEYMSKTSGVCSYYCLPRMVSEVCGESLLIKNLYDMKCVLSHVSDKEYVRTTEVEECMKKNHIRYKKYIARNVLDHVSARIRHGEVNGYKSVRRIIRRRICILLILDAASAAESYFISRIRGIFYGEHNQSRDVG